MRTLKEPGKTAARDGTSMENRIRSYFATMTDLAGRASVTDAAGAPVPLDAGYRAFIDLARQRSAAGGTLIFIGNGGSAAIASHMAIDYSKNGGLRATALNDASALTCLANDYGYEHVFAKQIEFHARSGDIVVAISSSGRSPNILNGVEAARRCACAVVTLSGFGPDNPLRRAGDLNFYVASDRYGFVEVIHLALIHSWLDLAMAEAAG